MNNQLILRPGRLGRLLKRDLIFQHRRTLWAAAAIAGLLIAIAIVQLWDNDRDILEINELYFPMMILAGGFLFTSMSFRELDNSQSGHLYLTLPASNLEKFLSKLLISSIGFVVVATLYYALLALLINGLASSLFDFELPPFNPFQNPHWLVIKLYLVLQPIFLLGAITFRRYSWVKTTLTVIATGIAASAVFLIIFRLVFAKYFTGLWSFNDLNIQEVPSQAFTDFAENIGFGAVKFLFWIALPLLLWTVSYFKLKEKEI